MAYTRVSTYGSTERVKTPQKSLNDDSVPLDSVKEWFCVWLHNGFMATHCRFLHGGFWFLTYEVHPPHFSIDCSIAEGKCNGRQPKTDLKIEGLSECIVGMTVHNI